MRNDVFTDLVQKKKDFDNIMVLIKNKYSSVKAASFAQIEREVDLSPYPAMWGWNVMKQYVSNEYGLSLPAFFKREGFIGK